MNHHVQRPARPLKACCLGGLCLCLVLWSLAPQPAGAQSCLESDLDFIASWDPSSCPPCDGCDSCRAARDEESGATTWDIDLYGDGQTLSHWVFQPAEDGQPTRWQRDSGSQRFVWTFAHDADDRTFSWDLEMQGELITRHVFSLNNDGRVVFSESYAGHYLQSRTVYLYHGDGRLLEALMDNQGAGVVRYRIEMEYDDQERCLTLTESSIDANREATGLVRTRFDEEGRAVLNEWDFGADGDLERECPFPQPCTIPSDLERTLLRVMALDGLAAVECEPDCDGVEIGRREEPRGQ